MTLQELFEVLRRAPYRWHIEQDGRIRGWLPGDDEYLDYCPITAVARERTERYFGTATYEVAGAAVGLSDWLAARIVDAVNRRDTPYQSLRKAILSTLSLKEVGDE